MYSIKDVCLISGLTDRTVRNYIRSGLLKGEKLDGVWSFSDKDISEFINNKAVAPSICAKKNAIIYDFLADKKKKVNQICIIIDIADNLKHPQEISEFFCGLISKCTYSVSLRFSYEFNGDIARVIITGMDRDVLDIVNAYYASLTQASNS